MYLKSLAILGLGAALGAGAYAIIKNASALEAQVKSKLCKPCKPIIKCKTIYKTRTIEKPVYRIVYKNRCDVYLAEQIEITTRRRILK